MCTAPGGKADKPRQIFLKTTLKTINKFQERNAVFPSSLEKDEEDWKEERYFKTMIYDDSKHAVDVWT